MSPLRWVRSNPPIDRFVSVQAPDGVQTSDSGRAGQQPLTVVCPLSLGPSRAVRFAPAGGLGCATMGFVVEYEMKNKTLRWNDDRPAESARPDLHM
ncbi:hypothetical protein MTO96_027645 [Rhipicephalus appendiculatus]